jgi:hypothetical protein
MSKMFNVQELQTEKSVEYDAALKNFPDASIYHTRSWMELLQNTFAVAPRTLIALDGKDIVGILPMGEQKNLLGGYRLVSLPFSHQVPPLGSPEAVDALLQYSIDYFKSKNCSFLEFKCDVDNSPGYQVTQFVNTDLSLTENKGVLKKNLRPNTRQKLNQSHRNKDLSLRLASTPKDFRYMDDIMARTRRELGSLTYPKGFFQALAEKLTGHLRSEICYYQDLPIAMMVTSTFGKVAIHHYGASRVEPELRRLRPNNLLIWSAISWAKDMEAEIFDFGTSLLSQKGLISFKEGWGGLTRSLNYRVFPFKGTKVEKVSQEGQTAKYASLILKNLPLPIYKFLTPSILKALG